VFGELFEIEPGLVLGELPGIADYGERERAGGLCVEETKTGSWLIK